MTRAWKAVQAGPLSLSVSGPGVDDLVFAVVRVLADATQTDDGLADRWSDVVITRRNLANAAEYGVEDVGLEQLEDAAAAAWDALVDDLPTSVRLPFAEARQLAGVLDEGAGRIGSVAA